jgi:hypothetical protein
VLALLALTNWARASDCTETELSSCIDSNSLWVPAGPSRFFAIDSSPAMAPGKLAVSLSANYFRAPIVLHAPAPDPNGIEVEAVDHVIDATFGLALGFASRFEATLSTSAVLSQTGSGVSAATAPHTQSVTTTALRDPRMGLGFDIINGYIGSSRIGLKLSTQISAPLGDEGAFAGERGWVVAPGVSLVHGFGRFTISNQLGLRLRAPVTFGDTRVGHQLLEALGIGVEALDARRLEFMLEAWVLPMLVSQDVTRANGTRVESTTIPAEWMVSARSSFGAERHWIAQLGFGTAIPISEQRRTTSSGVSTEESFAAIGSARWRASFAIRYLTDVF